MNAPPVRVLVVDDEPQVASMIEDVLVTLGYVVHVAANGPDALAALADFRPHVVLLDLGLPEMPGDVVLERLHHIDPHLPVIVATGNTDVDLARRTLAQGAFDYIGKPFDLATLSRVVGAAAVYRG
jgi:two-component system KDP operon response regulator KdpE